MPQATTPAIPDTPAWQALARHAATLGERRITDLFASDRERATRLSRRFGDILFDFSKQLADPDTLGLLIALADETGVKDAMDAMFAGAPVNVTERRPALHTALRIAHGALGVDGARDAAALAVAERQRLYRFLRTDIDGGSYRHIVHLGIGGSDLGPRLLLQALCDRGPTPLTVHFAANLDDQDLQRCLAAVDPARTLFVVASKSFSTQETLANAGSAWRWLQDHGITDADSRFVAVTANVEAARSFGIAADRIFRIWDWVGGRYSLWSAVSLPVVAAIGCARFDQLLAGAAAMDEHCRCTAAADNIPLLFALLDTWNSVLLRAPTRAVVPYDERLRLLPDYLQQLVMESNGKRVTAAGEPLPLPSSPVLWGGVGSNAQHAFFQLLHQGTHCVPVDFLVGTHAPFDRGRHALLVANCLAQGRALMEGRANAVDPHRHFPGNQPSNTIMYADLTPYTLGALLAFFEHRTVAAAMLIGINPFDQWGVELGKELARSLAAEMEQGTDSGSDASTRMLLEFYRRTCAGN